MQRWYVFFHALAWYLNDNRNNDAHTFQLFTEFISKSGYDPNNFCRVAIDDLLLVEEKIDRNI